MKEIVIIGAGGRTGSLFAEELKKSARIKGIAGKNTSKKIKEGQIFIKRNDDLIKFDIDLLEGDISKENPDFVFITTKNPVSPILKEYLSKFNKPFNLILSQNGFLAGEEAKETIEEFFKEFPPNIRIIRLSLFNAVYESKNSEVIISYKTPIKIAFGVLFGRDYTEDLEEIFTNAGFEFTKVPQNMVKNMEYSKLFSNLIGLASLSRGLNILDGLKDKETFIEEVEVLKEYVKVVKSIGGDFLNIKGYPIKTFSNIVSMLPATFLSIFRNLIADFVVKARGTKEKGNIDEIDYYLGSVIEIASQKRIQVETLERVFRRLK